MAQPVVASITFSPAILQQVLRGLKSPFPPKYIPVSLLYDGAGSSLYDQIVELEEYYPYEAERLLLQKHARRIAASVAPDSLIVELGCGSATKSALLLNALQAHSGRCQYVGIDVSGSALEQARINLLRSVPGLSPDSLHLVEGEYMEALKQVRAMFPEEVLCILWLGSSVGNFGHDDAVLFMREVLKIVGSRCQFFLCTDLWKDENMLYHAYYDGKGLTEKFIKNGMKNALELLGHYADQQEQNSWVYQVKVNKKLKRVEMWIIFPDGLQIEGHDIHLRPGEQVLVEISSKFRAQDVQELAAKSNFYIQETWKNNIYGCQMMCTQLQALLSCWADTDALFEKIQNWDAKPIDLRHPFSFYYGHVNSFTKLKLLPEEAASELDVMYSRGIDPLVLEPVKCHKHPEPPAQWPSMEKLCCYVKGVRSTARNAIESGSISMRLLCLVLEHERMHLETLSYMLAQQTKIAFENDYMGGRLKPKQTNSLDDLQGCDPKQDLQGCDPKQDDINYVLIPPGKFDMGCNPSDAVFVWDNEQPAYEGTVDRSFWVSSKPVTIRQFMEFVEDGGYHRGDLWEEKDFAHFKEKGYKWPATWSHVGGQYYVHNHFISRHWMQAAEEPVYVSLAEAEAYCNWVGNNTRIMTEEEYERIITAGYDQDGKVESLREGGWEWTSSIFKGHPGFCAMEEYPEYSTDFFDGLHYVLKGSSPTTHPALVRETFRNFYQRQYRYMYAKFRCCILDPVTTTHPDPSRPLAAVNGCTGYRSAVFGHV